MGVQRAQVGQQRAQGDNVLPVVLHDLGQQAHIPGAQELKVAPGSLAARQIALPGLIQDQLLHAGEPAAADALLPGAPRRIQEVQLLHVPPAIPHAAHRKARLKQRKVKIPSIKCAHRVEALHAPGELIEHVRLVGVVLHQVLLHHEVVALRVADAHQKGHRARAAGEPRGLGVEKQALLQMEASALPADAPQAVAVQIAQPRIQRNAMGIAGHAACARGLLLHPGRSRSHRVQPCPQTRRHIFSPPFHCRHSAAACQGREFVRCT